jgi:hypothetical protein
MLEPHQTDTAQGLVTIWMIDTVRRSITDLPLV